MLKVHKTLLCVLAAASLVSCHCPTSKTHALGECSFQITCIGTIHGVQLSEKCLEATNEPPIVRVNLNDAVDRFDNTMDREFLVTITNLKISAKWQEASLAILQYTNRLKYLYLVDIGLEKISPAPFQYLYNLEELNLSHNKLTEVEDLFQFHMHPNKLKRLWLSYNAIENLTAFAFEELSSLTELDLSYNAISDLSEEPFYNLTQLKTLRLNNNRIKDLNGAVNNLVHLKHLYLRGNHIQNIDEESLKIIEHLETFDVSLNQLEEIQPVMFSRHWDHFGNYSRCKIILSDNHISSVPNGTANEMLSRQTRNSDGTLVDIHTELDLSTNSINKIEYNAFQSLIRIVFLNLSNNKIFDFIVNANDLAYLKYLNLSSNHISHLYYESFSLMNNLQKLDLSGNHLQFIPDMTFNNNYNLKLVNMTYNDIEKIDSIRITMFHEEGGVLDLSNNALFKLKVPCGEGLRLVTLILHSNNISDTSLVDLRQQTELRSLDMSKNYIWELDINSLLLPVNLTTLDLSFNEIQRIGPSTFHIFEQLKILRLGHNQLIQIEYGMFNGLAALLHLDLSYNRIGYLDAKLLTDLKSLQILSVRSNDMNYLDYKSWFAHKADLQVYIDNNNLTCDWLGKALSDYNNGYSKMRPVVLVASGERNSVDGIPCVADTSAALIDASHYTMADERLLMTSQKILEAVREQNYYLRNFMLHYFREGSEKCKKDC